MGEEVGQGHDGRELQAARRWLERVAAGEGPVPDPEPGWAGVVAVVLAARGGEAPPEALVARPAADSAAEAHTAGLAGALGGSGAVANERARYHARFLLHHLEPEDPEAAPRVSVVIPVYEAAGLVVEAVASAVAQTHPRIEVLVVDDGSTDRPEVALAPWLGGEHPVRIVRQENRGAAAARNRGIEEARGELVHFLDADDTLEPDAVSRQVAALRADPAAELCVSRYRSSGADPGSRGAFGPGFGDAFCPTRDLLATWVRRYPFQTSTVLIPRWLLLETGPFEEEFAQGEDARYWFRLALRDARVVAIDAPLATRCFRPGSLSGSESALGPILFAMAVVRLLEEPRRWPYLGPLLVRMQGRERWRWIDRHVDERLDAQRAAMLDAVARLVERAHAARLSARATLTLLRAQAVEATAHEAGGFLARMADAIRVAEEDAEPPGVADLELWLGGGNATAAENAPAAGVCLAWLAECAARGELPIARSELARFAARAPEDAHSRALLRLGSAPKAWAGWLAFRITRLVERVRGR